MMDSVTGVILAGGKSTRMGKNKSFLSYRGKNLIDVPIETLTGIFSDVVLSVRDPQDYSGYSLPKVVDQYSEIGPMGGITSVLKSRRQRIFCVACDMPFLNQALIKYLCDFLDFDAVIPVWEGRAEVMHSVYSDRLVPAFENAISSHLYKITDALKASHVRYVNADEIRRLDPSGDTFRNVNTPMDYEKL